MLPIPVETQKVFGTARKWPNLALLLERYGWFPEAARDEKVKKTVLSKLLDYWQKDAAAASADAVRARLEADLADRRAHGWTVATIEGTTAWRALSGLGEHSVFETAITLHSLYGFPYFRGSATKGMTRAYARDWLGEDDGSPLMREIFGNPWGVKKDFCAAHVEFLGGLPVEAAAIELDIMNPHYPDWYREGKPPADWCNPIPVYFLTIGPGTRFRFYLAGDPEHEDATARAGEWHREALEEIGVGAKTAAGYGYFTDLRIFPGLS